MLPSPRPQRRGQGDAHGCGDRTFRERGGPRGGRARPDFGAFGACCSFPAKCPRSRCQRRRSRRGHRSRKASPAADASGGRSGSGRCGTWRDLRRAWLRTRANHAPSPAPRTRARAHTCAHAHTRTHARAHAHARACPKPSTPAPTPCPQPHPQTWPLGTLRRTQFLHSVCFSAVFTGSCDSPGHIYVYGKSRILLVYKSVHFHK